MLGVEDIRLINIRDYIIPEFVETITDDYTFTSQGILNHEGLGWKVSVNSKYDINLGFNGNKDYNITINIGPYYEVLGNLSIIKWIKDITKIKKQEIKKLSNFAQTIISIPNISRDMDLKYIQIFNVIVDGNEVEWRADEAYVSKKYPEYTCDLQTEYFCDITSPLIGRTTKVIFSEQLEDNLKDYQEEMIRYSIYGLEPTQQKEQSQKYHYYGEKNLYDGCIEENQSINDYDFDKLTNILRKYYHSDYLEPNRQINPIYYLKNKWKNRYENKVAVFLVENSLEELSKKDFDSDKKYL